ncbi:hypothetical protein KCP70_19480 [Salmonella enterica subsp. enterica]|nr:hypothetical protein KCP70_19480 [Salmonella enterica subsp. enterica]
MKKRLRRITATCRGNQWAKPLRRKNGKFITQAARRHDYLTTFRGGEPFICRLRSILFYPEMP